jgi:signal transduction histidine kinase
VSACCDDRSFSIERLLRLFAWELFHSVAGDVQGLCLIVGQGPQDVLFASAREGARLSDETFLHLIAEYERSGLRYLIRDHFVDVMCDAANNIRTSMVVPVKMPLKAERAESAYLWMGLAQAASGPRVERATRVAAAIGEALGAMRATIVSLCGRHHAIDQLREYQREVLSFAHDVRAPLGALRYSCALKAVPDAMTVLATNELAYIEKMLSRLVGVADEPNGEVACDLVAVGTHVLQRYAGMAAERNVSLQSAFPYAGRAHGISAIDCERVLSNLVGNALRYSEGTKLLLTVRQEGLWMRILVADDGIGIAPGMVAHIQAGICDSLPEAKGWGIGLISSKQRIEDCGGRFSIKSTVGAGTTIEIELRAGASERDSEDLREQVCEYGVTKAAAAPCRELFVVDDDTDHNHSLSRVLGLSGIRVRSFQSVGELIKELPQQQVPPIVCDINMPDGGGN